MDKKILIIGSLLTAVILFGGVFVFANSSTGPSAIEKTTGVTIKVDHKEYDFKNIKYQDGNVSHAFPIVNEGTKDLTLANLSTSCMCTKVFLKKGNEEGPKFGMKGHAQGSDWKGVLKPKEKGEIVVVFDPQAHGPQGVGPVSRFVSFETNDPGNPYVEFAFQGVVIK